MRSITRTTICVAAAAAMAAPAFAATKHYLKLDDVKGESAAKAGGGKEIEILSWSWGATMAGAWDGTIKGRPPSAAKYGAVGGAHRDDSVTAPLDRGSVRVKVKFPWLDCRVGAAFPDAVLQNDAGRYELKDVVISGCAPDTVELNYAKVKVRGWNPETKEL